MTTTPGTGPLPAWLLRDDAHTTLLQSLCELGHRVSPCLVGESCSACGALATHKIGEVTLPGSVAACGLVAVTHPATAYLCCAHFGLVLGPAAGCPAAGPGAH